MPGPPPCISLQSPNNLLFSHHNPHHQFQAPIWIFIHVKNLHQVPDLSQSDRGNDLLKIVKQVVQGRPLWQRFVLLRSVCYTHKYCVQFAFKSESFAEDVVVPFPCSAFPDFFCSPASLFCFPPRLILSRIVGIHHFVSLHTFTFFSFR